LSPVPVVSVCELRERILKEKGCLSLRTLIAYRWMFDRVEAFSGTWFTDAFQVNEFIGQLKGLNDQSVANVFKLLRAVGRYCARVYGWPDPTENADCPQVRHKQRRYFTSVELVAIVGACRSLRDKALILVLLDSSARIGELAGLRVEDLRESSFLVSGKTGQRSYRCDYRLVEMLRECAVDGVVFPVLGKDRRVICPVRSVSGTSLGFRVRYIFQCAGLKGGKLGPHTLRHTAASIVARESGSALAVKSLLQHDNISTSMIYIHDVEDVIQQRVSPLKLSGVGMRELSSAMLVDALPCCVEAVKVSGVDLGGLFPVIPDGLKVRPALSSEDLRLIRDGLIELMRVHGEYGSGSVSVRLLWRVLRRV